MEGETMKDVHPTRYFWVEGGAGRGANEYHWLADCPWLTVEVTRGAALVSSDQPPSDAKETELVEIPVNRLRPISTLGAELRRLPQQRTVLDRKRGRWLCAICEMYKPNSEPKLLDMTNKPCCTCRCPQQLHEMGGDARIFDSGCSMGWLQVMPLDAPPEEQRIGILHCRCDGFRPMAS